MEQYEKPQMYSDERQSRVISACVPAVFGVMACVWNVVGGVNYAVVAVGVAAVAAAAIVYGVGVDC